MPTYSPTESQVPLPPFTTTFALIQRSPLGVLHTNWRKLPSFPKTQTDSNDIFSTFLGKLPLTIQHVLGKLAHQEIDLNSWVEAFQAGTVEAASDGSVKEGVGTYAM
eukprot:12661958-Ditylum_brightwellii.AAC.1